MTRLWKRFGRRSAVALAGAAALALVLAAVCAGRHGTAPPLPTATARRGDLAIEITSVGELQAVRSLSFGVPRLRSSAAKVAWLVPEGSTVSPGDTLARFETTEILRRIEELESRLLSARANLEKLHASQRARFAEMEAGLEDQKAALRLAELSAANVSYEARVEQEKAQLTLQRARLSVAQAESKLQAQRTIDAAEVTEQRVTVAGLENQLRAEREALANHAIVAPTGGLVVYGTNWAGTRNAKIKVGDQIYHGGVVLELPDLSQMRVTSFVNEARVDQLREGARCDVRVDAFPDSVYRGAVTRINVLGRELAEAAGVKVFDYEVLLDGHDARLRPGMTATVLVHVEALHDVIYAPIETVHADESGTWVLRRAARRFERVPVTVGRQNDFHVVLSSGVQPGDELALRLPKEEEEDGR
jgi:multidrug efflux pump subunit AcrA (membrane-fusion protein)